MSDSSNARDEFGTVEGMILDRKDVFTKHGLSYVEMRVEHSNLLGDLAVFLFRNKQNGMQMRLTFFPGSDDRPRSFVMNITNKRGQKMDVTEFLRVHHREDLLKMFTDKEPGSGSQVFCSGFLDTLEKLFSTQLKRVLDGAEWEVVPFNWGDYK